MIFQLLSDLPEAERTMLLRMKMADELIAPSHGLYTVAHPFRLQLTEPTPTVNVPIPIVPTAVDTTLPRKTQTSRPLKTIPIVPTAVDTPSGDNICARAGKRPKSQMSHVPICLNVPAGEPLSLKTFKAPRVL